MNSLANRTSTVLAITENEELASIKQELNAFLEENSTNPFLLYPFISQLMLKVPKDQIPLVLVVKKDDKIIGCVSLRLWERYGFRNAESLHKPTSSPDIVVKPDYRQEVIREILFALFNKLRCKSITITLPAESTNLQAIKEECTKRPFTFCELHDETLNHCILKVNDSWANYQRALSHNYRREIKRTERQLSSLGHWQIRVNQLHENDKTNIKTLKEIESIESGSWKEKWRLQNGNRQDEDLKSILQISDVLARTNSLFKAYIWVLELNDKPVAYQLVLCHRDKAIFAKTSYVKSIAKTSPGFFVTNGAIEAMFNGLEIETIDFLTALPYMQKWHPTVLPRIKLEIRPKKQSLIYIVITKLAKELQIALLSPISSLQRLPNLVKHNGSNC